MNRLLTCFSIAGFVLVSACGSEPESQVPAAADAPPAPAAAVPSQQEKSTERMARAVGDGKPGAAVEIRYDFGAKPAAGVPTELEIVFIPSVGVDALEITIGGMEGVTVSGVLTASFAAVEAGKPYTHTVHVLPDQTGVYYISVTANTQIGSSTLARTFSIPFVVGDPPAQQKAAPKTDATGQAIEPMQAEETTRGS